MHIDAITGPAIAALILALLAVAASAIAASPGEMAAARAWAGERFTSDSPAFFSFGYGPEGDIRPAVGRLQPGPDGAAVHVRDGGITERTVTWTDPDTGLEVRCVGLEYADFPAVEWTLHFRNAGTQDTPILDSIQALDATLAMTPGRGARLRHARGSWVRMDDFAPMVTSLGANEGDPAGFWHSGSGNPVRIEPENGRSSSHAMPFFNVDMFDHGVIEAIGWTGEWEAAFGWQGDTLRLQAGMKRTHLRLRPGEEIRSPGILLLFWEGDWLRGQNLLRRFIRAHHAPEINGQTARVPLCLGAWGENYSESFIAQARWLKEQQLPVDYLWVDAGWYGAPAATSPADAAKSEWCTQVGNWFPNPTYYPGGMAPLGEALQELGIGFLLWHEPERACMGTAWAREHPEYLLGEGEIRLVNLGNPDARRMVIDHLTRHIAEGRISCLRQDFNMDPRGPWAWGDAPDRIGMTEIQHITGLYEVWDTLRERFPGLLIDNCAGGGQRIDLETLSRSLPLWRDDVQTIGGYSITAMQTQTHGLGLWTPLSPGVCDREDDYAFRSALGPGMVLNMGEFQTDQTKHFSIEWLRRNLAQFEEVRDLFLGDFYPLLEFSLSEDAWAVWQYDRPERGDGMVIAFRRAASPFDSLTIPLRTLDPAARCALRNLDTGETAHHSGHDLTHVGLPIAIPARPGSALFTYRRL